MQNLINILKPYECEAYDGAIGFASHKTWTRQGAMGWAKMYPKMFNVVIWRAASFNRLPKIDSQRS